MSLPPSTEIWNFSVAHVLYELWIDEESWTPNALYELRKQKMEKLEPWRQCRFRTSIGSNILRAPQRSTGTMTPAQRSRRSQNTGTRADTRPGWRRRCLRSASVGRRSRISRSTPKPATPRALHMQRKKSKIGGEKTSRICTNETRRDQSIPFSAYHWADWTEGTNEIPHNIQLGFRFVFVFAKNKLRSVFLALFALIHCGRQIKYALESETSE